MKVTACISTKFEMTFETDKTDRRAIEEEAETKFGEFQSIGIEGQFYQENVVDTLYECDENGDRGDII